MDPFFEGIRVGDLGRSEWWVGRGRNGRTLGSKSRSVAGVTVAQWKSRVATAKLFALSNCEMYVGVKIGGKVCLAEDDNPYEIEKARKRKKSKKGSK